MSTKVEPTANPNEVYIALLPLVYDGAVPTPSTACTDPTPEEQIKAATQEREDALRLREREIQVKEAAATQRSTHASSEASTPSTVQQLKDGAVEAIGGLRSLVSQVSVDIEKVMVDATTKAYTQARAMDHQQNYDRFFSYFGEDLVKGQGEVLLASYGCSAMHNGQKVDGHIFITRNYLCFAATFSSIFASAADSVMQAVSAAARSGDADPSGGKAAGIKQVIPLKNVASLQKSITLPTVDGGAPYFLSTPADYVISTALQVYETEERKLFQFLGFDTLTAKAGSALSTTVKGTPLDRAYNHLDHAWREAVQVPLAGIQYA